MLAVQLSFALHDYVLINLKEFCTLNLMYDGMDKKLTRSLKSYQDLLLHKICHTTSQCRDVSLFLICC